MAIQGKAILLGFLASMAMAGAAVAGADISTQAGSPMVTPSTSSSIRLAQLKLNLGMSRREARRLLSKKGYRDIRITKTSFKNIRAEACLGGIRYAVKVRRLSGKVKRGSQISKCRRPLSAQEIAARLGRQGLDKISVSPVGRDEFTAIACDYDMQVRLDIDAYGEVIQRSVTGWCQRGPNLTEILRQLRQDGFTRIQVVKKNPRRLIVEACFVEDRVRLRLAENGRIQRRNIIGTCTRPIRPREIVERLRALGFRQINVIDRELPVYQAEACRKNSLLRIRMNRYGEVISTSRLGRCSPPLTRQQIVAMLKQRGANRIKILSSNAQGFRVAACYKLERRQYRIDPYGTILNREVLGRCIRAPRLNTVLKDFRSRGIKDLRLFVEGCRNGRKLQIELDQYGDEVNRRRIGRC